MDPILILMHTFQIRIAFTAISNNLFTIIIMADEVIVFDCDEDDQDEHKLPESNPQVKPTQTKPNIQMKGSKYAQLLRLRRLRVRPKEQMHLQPSEIEGTIDLEKSEEVVVFDLEQPGSIAQQDINSSQMPLRTAHFRELTPKPQVLQQQPHFDPPPPHPVERQLSQEERRNTQQQSDGDSIPSQPNHMEAPPESHAENLLAAFVPKKSILSVQSELRIERFLMFPQKFHMYLNGNHLITARKKLMQSNSLYYFFSSSQNLSTKGNNYLGYMEANFNGTQYNIYTHDGINLAYITYLLKKNEQAMTNIYMPRIIQYKSEPIKIRVMADDPGIIVVNTKSATYNPATKKFSLNFRGRAKMASVKNCVIEQDGQYVLILGKVQQKQYNLDFGQPFSEMSAFGFAISNYEEKLGDKAKY